MTHPGIIIVKQGPEEITEEQVRNRGKVLAQRFVWNAKVNTIMSSEPPTTRPPRRRPRSLADRLTEQYSGMPPTDVQRRRPRTLTHADRQRLIRTLQPPYPGTTEATGGYILDGNHDRQNHRYQYAMNRWWRWLTLARDHDTLPGFLPDGITIK